MKKIYKYELSYRNGNKVKVSIPLGTEILSCDFQDEKLVVWGLVDTWQTHEREYEFLVLRTGEEIPNVVLKKFIGTANDKEPMPFVLHVFLLQYPHPVPFTAYPSA